MFRSGLEVQIAELLDNYNVKYGYEVDELQYTISHSYTPDFSLDNGVILEAKGYWRPEDRRKIINIKKQHPEIDLRMVFQDPTKTISKRSKTTYSQWCDKYDIPWCSYKNIPIKWLIPNETNTRRLP